MPGCRYEGCRRIGPIWLPILVFSECALTLLLLLSLGAAADKTSEGNEPPRSLETRGLDNLVAFSRLLGYVRYFHPSDQAAATDWDRFAIDGVRAVEGAKDPDALARVLERLFRPIAPSVRSLPDRQASRRCRRQSRGAGPTGGKGAATATLPPRVLAWRHIGVGLGRSPVYSSQRIDLRMPRPLFGQKLPRRCRSLTPASHMPRTWAEGSPAWSRSRSTRTRRALLPRPDLGEQTQDQAGRSSRRTPPSGFQPSGNDRATRLAAVVLAWNVFQHFYPYFDVVDADWPGELRRALARAAEDADERAFMPDAAPPGRRAARRSRRRLRARRAGPDIASRRSAGIGSRANWSLPGSRPRERAA